MPTGKVVKACITIPIPQPASGYKNHNLLESELIFMKKALSSLVYRPLNECKTLLNSPLFF